MMLTMSHGIPPIRNCSVHRAKKTERLSSGMHDVSLTLALGKLPFTIRISSVILFRKSQHTAMSPEGFAYTNKLCSRWQSSFVCLSRSSVIFYDVWQGSRWRQRVLAVLRKRGGLLPLPSHRCFIQYLTLQITASTAMFNHAGDGVILTHHSEHTLRVMDYPALTLRENPAAHVGGCVAVALDPRGR